MEVVKELVYIVGGIILADIIRGAYRFFQDLMSGKSISLVHAIFCLISPFVVWQFIQQFTTSLDKNNLNDENAFWISLAAISNLTFLTVLARMIYPAGGLFYTTEDVNFRKYLKQSRRIFFGLVTIYMVVVTTSNWAVKDPIPLGVWLARIAMFVISFVCAVLNLEPNSADKNRIDINFRYPVIKLKKNEHGLGMIKKINLWRLAQVTSLDPDKTIQKVYDRLDIVASIVIFFAFAVIVWVKN